MNMLDDLFEKFSAAIKGGLKMEYLDSLLCEYHGVDWKPYKYFTPVHYSRFVIRINDILEMVIICWEPGQKWDLHDHPRDGEMIRVLQGEITISRYELLVKPHFISRKTIGLNEIYFQQGSTFGHELKNESHKRAVTLHFNSPPNFRPGFYG